jgi:hypothetical protein
MADLAAGRFERFPINRRHSNTDPLPGFCELGPKFVTISGARGLDETQPDVLNARQRCAVGLLRHLQ